MKRKTKENRAITLIALVITIIVLLILAGVTISALSGDNGILTNSSKAKVETDKAKINEYKQIAMLNAKMNKENQIYTDDNGDTATIPAGFAITEIEGEKLIDDGLVIIDSDGNEFVWVPVNNINEMAKLTSGTDSNNNLNYEGKFYDFTSKGFNEKINYGQSTTNFREPDTINYDRNLNFLNIIGNILKDEVNYISLDTFRETMQKDYNMMIKSIEKYHGFYIARYEMSKSTNGTAQSKANEIALTAEENSANTWYGLYAYGKTYNNSEDSVVSSMIWGSQYDAMTRWLQNNGIDVTDRTLPNGGTINMDQNLTGQEGDTDIVKNIYDIYGGRYEWTLEGIDVFYRCTRGGVYYGSNAPSERYYYDSILTNDYYSSRFTLYLK